MLSDLFSLPIAHRGLFSSSMTQHGAPTLRHDQAAPAHAAAWGRGIENSLSAFSNAIDHGFAIECDVRLSSDGVPCVFHDERLERLTGATGLFEQKTWSELQKIQLLNSLDRVPRLREVLALCIGKVPLVIELKSFDQTGWHKDLKLEKAVLQEITDFARAAKGSMCLGLKSFNPISVEFLLDHAGSKWPIGFLSCRHSADGDFDFLGAEESSSLENLTHPAAQRAHFVSYSITDLSTQIIQSCMKPMMTWTIRNTVQLEKAKSLGAVPIFEEAVAQELVLRQISFSRFSGHL